MEWHKVVTSLVIAAIIGFVSGMISLSASVYELSEQIAVIKQGNLAKTAQCTKCDEVIERIERMLSAHNERLLRLEFYIDKKPQGWSDG